MFVCRPIYKYVKCLHTHYTARNMTSDTLNLINRIRAGKCERPTSRAIMANLLRFFNKVKRDRILKRNRDLPPILPLIDLLRRKGAIILKSKERGGLFDAVALYGSKVAGVIDSRRARPLSQSELKVLVQKSRRMGFTDVAVVHGESQSQTKVIMEGVFYLIADFVNDDLQEKDDLLQINDASISEDGPLELQARMIG